MSVNAVESVCQTKIVTTAEIDGKLVKIQTESGALCNLLSQKIVSKGTEITQTNQTLFLHSKTSIPVPSICGSNMKNSKNNKRYGGDFVIVKDNCVPLLGSRVSNFMPLLGSRISRQMKTFEVYYENIMNVDHHIAIDYDCVNVNVSEHAKFARVDFQIQETPK